MCSPCPVPALVSQWDPRRRIEVVCPSVPPSQPPEHRVVVFKAHLFLKVAPNTQLSSAQLSSLWCGEMCLLQGRRPRIHHIIMEGDNSATSPKYRLLQQTSSLIARALDLFQKQKHFNRLGGLGLPERERKMHFVKFFSGCEPEKCELFHQRNSSSSRASSHSG